MNRRNVLAGVAMALSGCAYHDGEGDTETIGLSSEVVVYNHTDSVQRCVVTLYGDNRTKTFDYTIDPGKLDESQEFAFDVLRVAVQYQGAEQTASTVAMLDCPKSSPGDVTIRLLDDGEVEFDTICG